MTEPSPEERESICAPVEVPSDMAPLLREVAWSRDNVGQSGGAVYRLRDADGTERFLKHGRGPVAEEVTDEMARLRWLDGRLPVPSVLHFIRTPADGWLLTDALPGRTASQVLEDDPAGRPALVEELARFLHRIHALPVDACPFDSGHRVRMAAARARIDAGLVDVDDFDDVRRGWSAEQVWKAVGDLLPLRFDRVVTHGDFSLDNIIMAEDRVVGCIDVGRVGTADPYQDLAILWNCLGEFDPALQDALLESYGVPPDRRKLDFHLMLDEFF